MTVDARGRTLHTRGEREAVIGGHEHLLLPGMAFRAGCKRKPFPCVGGLRGDADNRVRAMAVTASGDRDSPPDHAVNAPAETGKLLPVVAGEAVDRLDVLCVGEIGRAEADMAGYALESRMRRRLQSCGINVQ